eukprot:4886743-Alexandrium_andersonii.AAC.1
MALLQGLCARQWHGAATCMLPPLLLSAMAAAGLQRHSALRPLPCLAAPWSARAARRLGARRAPRAAG